MALTSPGVEVTVTDESFYVPADQGMVPSIIVATAKNKTSGTGTGTAAGTLTANAGTVYTITSQRELTETFGDPTSCIFIQFQSRRKINLSLQAVFFANVLFTSSQKAPASCHLKWRYRKHCI